MPTVMSSGASLIDALTESGWETLLFARVLEFLLSTDQVCVDHRLIAEIPSDCSIQAFERTDRREGPED